MTISSGSIVSLKYTLKNSEGEILDESTSDDSFDYLHGAHNIVPGLERQLEGKNVGDKINAVVPPQEGYGLRSSIEPEAVARKHFPKDVEVGMQFMADDGKGQTMPFWVVNVDKDNVYVDANHPLAGETLHFDVEVLAIRKASKEEMDHGHPHGPDGHHH